MSSHCQKQAKVRETTSDSVTALLAAQRADVRMTNAPPRSFTAQFHQLGVLMSLYKLDLHPLLRRGTEANVELAWIGRGYNG